MVWIEFDILFGCFQLEITKRSLDKWLHALQTITESRSSRFSGWFGSGGRASPLPQVTSTHSFEIGSSAEDGLDNRSAEFSHSHNEPWLFCWLRKMRMVALTKFSLYFFGELL